MLSGIAQPTGVMERLEHMVGLSRSLDWVLTGRIIKPQEAYTCGIIARIVACGTSKLNYDLSTICFLCNLLVNHFVTRFFLNRVFAVIQFKETK